MTHIPQPQEIYRHFKGNLYEIVSLAEHTETGEQLVIYRALYGTWKIYARPLTMFMEKTDKVKYPAAEQEYRFELVSGVQEEENQKTQSECMKQESTVMQDSFIPTNNIQTETEQEQEISGLDPAVLEYLDADTYEQRLNILTGLHHKITNDMLTTMAVATDVELKDGEVEDRYEEFKNCLLTLDKYECNRLR